MPLNIKNQKKINEAEKNKRSFNIDLFVKILCVFAAFCMWVYVMQVESPEFEQTFSHITVELVGTEAMAENGLALYNGYGTMIDVTLSGKKSVISKLTEKDIIATADISAVTEGGSRVYCKVKVDVPAGCKLVAKSQDNISVYLDNAVKKTITLSENRENTKLPDDCYAGATEYPVDMVNISGPSKVLEKIDRAVVNLNLEGIIKTAAIKEDIVLLDKNGEIVNSPYVEYTPREVTVTVPIYKKVILPVTVDFTYGFLNTDNTEITIEPAFIEIEGEPAVINTIDHIKPVEIDEKNDFMFESGNKRYIMDYNKTVILDIPDNVKASSREAHITAALKKSMKTIELTVPGINILDTGAREGVTYTYDKDPVTVLLCGEYTKITKINAEDIMLKLDMSPYTVSNTGSMKVRADIIIDSAYADGVFEVGDYSIWVTFDK